MKFFLNYKNILKKAMKKKQHISLFLTHAKKIVTKEIQENEKTNETFTVWQRNSKPPKINVFLQGEKV